MIKSLGKSIRLRGINQKDEKCAWEKENEVNDNVL